MTEITDAYDKLEYGPFTVNDIQPPVVGAHTVHDNKAFVDDDDVTRTSISGSEKDNDVTVKRKTSHSSHGSSNISEQSSTHF